MKKGGFFAAFSRKPKNKEVPANIPEEDDWETPVDDGYTDDESGSDDMDMDDIELIEIPQDIPDAAPMQPVQGTDFAQNVPVATQDAVPAAIPFEPEQSVISELPEIEVPDDIPEIEMVKTEVQVPEPAPIQIPDIPEAPSSEEIPMEGEDLSPMNESEMEIEVAKDNTPEDEWKDEGIDSPEDSAQPAEVVSEAAPAPQPVISEEERLATLMPETKAVPAPEKPEPAPAPAPAAKPMTEEERLNALLNGL